MITKSLKACRSRELNAKIRIYDLASILPFHAPDLRQVKLAMKVGGEYRFRNIGLWHWQRLATETRLDECRTIDRVRTMAAALPDHATDVLFQIEWRDCLVLRSSPEKSEYNAVLLTA